KIAGGIILLLVSLDMLSAKRQQRKKQGSDKATESAENVAVFPLAIPLLAGPAAITSVMVVSADLAGDAAQSLIGYGALGAVMGATAIILVLTGLAQNFIDTRIASVFSRVTAIILAALSVQYIIDGLLELGLMGTAS
ncbi:MAG: MarC family protein, partial [Candidatus Puniceispirillum sp.]